MSPTLPLAPSIPADVLKLRDRTEVISTRPAAPEGNQYTGMERGDLGLGSLAPKLTTEFTCSNCWLFTALVSTLEGICRDCAGEHDQPHSHTAVKHGHTVTKW